MVKNPWAWIAFVAVVLGISVVVFRGGSEVSLEKYPADDGNGDQIEKLSKKQSEELVSKLETDLSVPEEVIGSEEGETSSAVVEGGEGENGERVTKSVESGMTADPTEGSMEDPKGEEAEVSEGDVKEFSIANRPASWGFQSANGRKTDTVVLHSTYNATGGDPFSVSKIIDIYKSYGVSPHYLVARDGAVYRMVDEKNIAYHAGDSKMSDGRTNVNAFSIGIEVIGKDDGSPSEAQYESLKKLLADIKKRHDIKHILGHSDIAPGRKSDPWGFSWKKIGGKEL